MTLKVGDRVILVASGGFSPGNLGREGVIDLITTSANPRHLRVRFDGGGADVGTDRGLRLISEAAPQGMAPFPFPPGEYDMRVDQHGRMVWTPKPPPPPRTCLDYNRELLELLRAEIEAYPDRRFGQTIVNLFMRLKNAPVDITDLFYEEPSDTLQRGQQRSDAR